MTDQTPNQSAALHCAEIELVLHLNPDKPIPQHLQQSLLRHLGRLHTEASLLTALNDNSIQRDDDRDLRRLQRLSRSLAPIPHFLIHTTPSADIRLVPASVRVLTAFVQLRVALTFDHVTALFAFVTLASKDPSRWLGLVVEYATDYVPALQILLEEIPEDRFFDVAVPALPVLTQVVIKYLERVKEIRAPSLRHGLLATVHLTVDLISAVIQKRSSAVSSINSYLEELTRQTATLAEFPDERVLRSDFRKLLSLVSKIS